MSTYRYYYLSYSFPYKILEMDSAGPRSPLIGLYTQEIIAKHEMLSRQVEFYKNKLKSESKEGRKKYRGKIKNTIKKILKIENDNAEFFI